MVPANLNFTVTLQYIPFDLVGSQIQATAANAWEASCTGFWPASPGTNRNGAAGRTPLPAGTLSGGGAGVG